MQKKNAEKKQHVKQSGKKKPAPRQPRYTQKQVIEAISGTGGIVAQIAERLRCQRGTIYKYMHAYPAVMEAYQTEKELVLDIAEEGLIGKVYAQDFAAITYYLSKKGHERGYADHLRVDANVDAKVSEMPTLKIVIESEERD